MQGGDRRCDWMIFGRAASPNKFQQNMRWIIQATHPNMVAAPKSSPRTPLTPQMSWLSWLAWLSLSSPSGWLCFWALPRALRSRGTSRSRGLRPAQQSQVHHCTAPPEATDWAGSQVRFYEVLVISSATNKRNKYYTVTTLLLHCYYTMSLERSMQIGQHIQLSSCTATNQAIRHPFQSRFRSCFPGEEGERSFKWSMGSIDVKRELALPVAAS